MGADTFPFSLFPLPQRQRQRCAFQRSPLALWIGRSDKKKTEDGGVILALSGGPHSAMGKPRLRLPRRSAATASRPGVRGGCARYVLLFSPSASRDFEERARCPLSACGASAHLPSGHAKKSDRTHTAAPCPPRAPPRWRGTEGAGSDGGGGGDGIVARAHANLGPPV